MWPGSQALGNGGAGGISAPESLGAYREGSEGFRGLGPELARTREWELRGSELCQRVPRGHPGEARGQQQEAGAQPGLARNPGGLQALTQGRLVPALLWGCRPPYLDQSSVPLIQNWDQEVPGNKTRAVSAGKKTPQQGCTSSLSSFKGY